MKWSFFLLGLLVLPACQADNIPSTLRTQPSLSQITVSIDNALSACVAVEPVRQGQTSDHIEQILALRVKQSIGHCGCTSAQMAVYSDGRQTEHSSAPNAQELAKTVITVKGAGEYTVNLGTAEQLSSVSAVKLSLRCQGPM